MVEAFCVMFLSWRYGRHLSWSHVSPLQHFSRPSLYLLSIIFATTVFNSQWLPSVCVCVLIVMIWVWTYSYYCISKHTKGEVTLVLTTYKTSSLLNVIFMHIYLSVLIKDMASISSLTYCFFSIFFPFLCKFVEIKSWIFFFLFYVWICSLLP